MNPRGDHQRPQLQVVRGLAVAEHVIELYIDGVLIPETSDLVQAIQEMVREPREVAS